MDKQTQRPRYADTDNQLIAELDNKTNYLVQLNESVKTGNDLKIYELINTKRYNKEFKKQSKKDLSPDYFELASDLSAHLSHHLSDNLIDYLAVTYPFFYYHEKELGKFTIYFGNWWDRREFGELDTLNVQFNFNQEEYDKLSRSFELEGQNSHVTEEQMNELAQKNQELEKLIADQDLRDQEKNEIREQIKENEAKTAMPWESGKIKEERQQLKDRMLELSQIDEQAASAHQEIKENEKQILALSKEETILNLEKQNIRNTFGSFSAFINKNNQLYVNYLKHLVEKMGVNDNE